LKRIGIITLSGDFNYGNRLQNFALQKVLKEQNLIVDTINIHNSKKKKYHKEFLVGYFQGKKDLIYIIKKISKKLTIQSFIRRRKYNKMIIEKQKKIVPFSNENISSININRKDLNNLNQKYDLFVAGSDQIWNPNIIEFEHVNFLSFCPKEKRYSYAASFGVSNLPETPINLKNHFKKYLSNMQYISVREEAGKKIVKDLLSISVDVAPDPTLLLSQDEWNIMISNKKLVYDKYIIVYFISNPSKSILDKIKKFAHDKNLKIIRIMGDEYNKNHCIYTPFEFIQSIRDAEYVFTDSFHGCVFSIIMNSKFFVFERSDKKGTQSRIIGLLRKFNLENFLILNEKPELIDVKFPVNFDGINEKLERERIRGKKLIQNNIINSLIGDS